MQPSWHALGPASPPQQHSPSPPPHRRTVLVGQRTQLGGQLVAPGVKHVHMRLEHADVGAHLRQERGDSSRAQWTLVAEQAWRDGRRERNKPVQEA